MLPKIAHVVLLLVLVSPLGWLALQKGEAGGLKRPKMQDAPEQASVPLTYGAAGYRFRVLQVGDPIPTGFEQPNFNDSSFDLGAAAFGAVAANSCAPPTTIRSVWPANTRLILRKKFTLPAGASNARLFVSVDNDIEKMWINGTQIETNRQNNNCAELDQFVYNLAPAQLVASENTLAWQLLDRGGPTHFDARVVVTIPDPTPGTCVAPPSGLVSWFRGEDNANDTISRHNGYTTNVTYAPGRVGRAFSFDGVGDVTIPTNANLVSNQFTLDTWVFPTLYDGGFNRVITRNGSYEISINGGDFYYYIRGVSGLPDNGGMRVFGGGPVRLNQWTHLALTYDGSRARSFINGRISRTITGVTGNVTTNTNPFIIGSDVGLTGPDKFDGRIDEVDFFSRALADTEIMAIYQADSAGKCGGVNAPPLPSLTMTGVSLPEGNSGTSNANLTARLSSPSILPVTVSYTTADVTARAGSDYIATNGTLTFAPGETSKNITVQVIGDTVFEPHETFSVNLFSAFNAAIASGMGAGTILNDDFAAVGVLGFGANNFTANEGDNFATVTLARTGELGGTSTVDVATQDNLAFVDCAAANGTALQRCDYTTTVTTVTFAPDETSKSFVIPIINDAYPEGNETITLNLSNSTGTRLSAQTGTTLTIVDNDSGTPNSNPIDAAQFFVRLNYYDFLNRLPDQGGFDFWTGQITMCGADIACINSRRIGVSAAFFVELEFQESGAYVYRLYRAAYGNNQPFPNPDTNPPGGSVTAAQIPAYAKFLPDRARVVGGASLEEGKLDFANQFAQRAEFIARYPVSQTPTQFVDAVLATINTASGVTFNAMERQNFINDATDGGRGLMLKNLGDNAAFKQAEFNRAFVLTQYFGYLRRDPDMAGYNFWLGVINGQPQNVRGMVCAFLTSTEYQQRFSSVVTRGNNLCSGMP